jgi:acetoin utilization protein AcuB
MCVADIMIADPVTVSPANSIGTAIKRMRQCGYRCLPVVEGSRLVGIVTDYELSRAANSPLVVREPWHDHFLLDLIDVRSCMNRTPPTVAPESQISEAARLVCEVDICALPVVSEHTLVGLVTTADLLKHLIHLLAE